MEDSSSASLIQLEREIRRIVLQRLESRQNARPDKLHPPQLEEWRFVLPRSFRSRRALAIACWFLPEELSWELLLELQDCRDNLDFSAKGLENSVQLGLLLSSKDFCLHCLRSQEFFSLRVLFGTILQEDLKKALLELKIKRRNRKVIRRVRRKGYQDKGTWRSPDRWLEKYDWTFVLEQENIEKKKLLITLVSLLIRRKIFLEEEK